MKRFALRFAIPALLATFTIPSLAQDVKTKEKESKDTKKEVEEITIIRKSDDKTKTVVEINGDKITIWTADGYLTLPKHFVFQKKSLYLVYEKKRRK